LLGALPSGLCTAAAAAAATHEGHAPLANALASAQKDSAHSAQMESTEAGTATASPAAPSKDTF
jgi:hypothetical protein